MSVTAASLPCHGKINLFLEIQDRRPDGFHNLGTLFQAVATGDVLHAEAWDCLMLDCPDGITPDRDQNLVLKAARLLKEKFSDRLKPDAGIKFKLEKNLPSAAGLGGGSSNAAAALNLCNRIWELGLPLPDLMGLAAQLGSDVPFFLHGGSAFGEGKGEIIQSAPSPYPFYVVIGTPQCRVETGWAYGQLPASRKHEWARFKALYFTYCEDWEFYQVLRNDFDAPMRHHFAPIKELTEQMQVFSPVKALLSGSGASVFALFKEKNAAQTCLDSIQANCRFSCLTEFVF